MAKLVGICNLSPESFSDGDGTQIALQTRIENLIADGADIIDLWAVSTAPDAPMISEDEELSRLQEAISFIRKFPDTVFSLDTTRASVARIGIAHGVSMINDVSWWRADPAMYALIAETGVQYVLMYCKNVSGRADKEPIIYPQGIVAHVIDFFHTQIALAEKAWVKREQIILDPWMGAFVSHDPMDSIRLLQAIPEIKKEFDLPVYICTSRKGFLGKLSQDQWPADRLGSSLASSHYAIQQGADYIRIHDVRWMRQVVDVIETIQGPLHS